MASAPKYDYDRVFLPVSILAGAIIIAASIYYSSGKAGLGSAAATAPTAPSQNQQQQQQQQLPGGQQVDISKVKTAGDPFVGNPNAPITIAYWFDYQCPFCKQYEENVMPTLLSDYVDAGKVKVVYKDFQFLGPDSQTLALAARAVWEVAPAKFYEWHKHMFDNQGRENSGWATTAEIQALTKEVLGSADTAKVMALMTSKAVQYRAEIDADKQEGQSFGISGTPSVIIGKQLLVGARPFSDIKAALDAVSK